MITIKTLQRGYNSTGGDLLVATVGNRTEVIIDTGAEHPGTPDIRVDDGEHIFKLPLTKDYRVQHVLRDDVPLTEQ